MDYGQKKEPGHFDRASHLHFFRFSKTPDS
jgi:hypothetical protein